jgi:hypothetical protein
MWFTSPFGRCVRMFAHGNENAANARLGQPDELDPYLGALSRRVLNTPFHGASSGTERQRDHG